MSEVEYTMAGLIARANDKAEKLGKLTGAIEYGTIGTLLRGEETRIEFISADRSERFYVLVKADGRTFCRGYEVSSTARDLTAEAIANFKTRTH
jgi:hypothetical protein